MIRVAGYNSGMTHQTILEFAAGGRLLPGTWQGIYLWEHRTAPHRRRAIVTVMGD